jgi:hypothetical protein
MSMAEEDDIELYLAHPIWVWQTTTETGRWVMEHTEKDLLWYSSLNPNGFSYDIAIVASLSEPAAVEFHLRFGII